MSDDNEAGPRWPLSDNKRRRTEPWRQEMHDGVPCSGYVIRWAFEETPTHWVDFAVFSVVGCDESGPMYPSPGAMSSMDTVSDIEEAAPTVEGFVKWDGCTQFSFPDAVHIDSRDDMDSLFEAIQYARQVAMVEIIAEKQLDKSEYPHGMGRR